MIFAFTDEQLDLRQTIRRFLEDVSPSAAVRVAMESELGYDPVVWRRLSTELGVTGLLVPGSDDDGGGFVEVAIAAEEAGRALLCAPFLSTLMAMCALREFDDPAARSLLRDIGAGQVLASLAVVGDDGDWWSGSISTRARKRGDHGPGFVLDGHKSYVLDGTDAQRLLVLAQTDSGPGLFVADGDAPGLLRSALPAIDQTRRLARLEFSGVPATSIGGDGKAGVPMWRAMQRIVIALAAEQVGCAQRCLDMAVAYAKVREQFGRPIGSFQAIKHKCADMLMEVEAARSAAYYAAWAVDADSDEVPMMASLAKAYCSETATRAAGQNIQIHGGIGFTWEHDAHLYLKRAKSSELMFGTPTQHRELLAELIGV
jgi:alkylation response protein AidB-like acyl-CoA dehydrogenase